MKKLGYGIFIIVIIFTVSVYFNQNKFFEQVFRFQEAYKKSTAGDVRLYVPPQSAYQTELVMEQLPQTREFVGNLLSQSYNSHPSVAVFVTEPGYRGHERIADVSGGYLYALGVILINGEDPQFASSLTVHEYTHFLFDLYLKEQGLAIEEIPDWLTEGFAEYVAFQVEQAIPQKYALFYDHFPFPDMHVQTNANVGAVYLQGFYAVTDLISRFGTGVIAQLVDAHSETSDFRQAFEQVTGIDYLTYHDHYFINRNALAKLSDLTESPEEMLTYGEALLANRADINPYSPFVLPELIKAALVLQEGAYAKNYFQQLEPLLFNPGDYLHYAAAFYDAGHPQYAEQLIERAKFFAAKYAFNMKEVEQQAHKIMTTSD